MIKISEKELEPLSKEEICPYCGAKLVLEDSVCSYCKTSEKEIKKIHKMKESIEIEKKTAMEKYEQIKKLIKEKKEELKKSKETKKEAETKDKNIRDLKEIKKWKKIIYFAEEHRKLCEAVINKHNELFEAYKPLWAASTLEEKKRFEEKVKTLTKELDEGKEELIVLKKYYKKDNDLKKDFRHLSRIPKSLRVN